MAWASWFEGGPPNPTPASALGTDCPVHCPSRDVPSRFLSHPEAVASLTQAGGEASGQHRAQSPRSPGPEETSCSKEWILLKRALELGSG